MDIPSFEKAIEKVIINIVLSLLIFLLNNKYVELFEAYPSIPKIFVGTKIDLRDESKLEKSKYVGQKTVHHKNKNIYIIKLNFQKGSKTFWRPKLQIYGM